MTADEARALMAVAGAVEGSANPGRYLYFMISSDEVFWYAIEDWYVDGMKVFNAGSFYRWDSEMCRWMEVG